MNRKVIEPIWIEVENFKLVVRWTHHHNALQVWANGFGFCCNSSIVVYGFQQGYWREAAIASIVSIFLGLLLLLMFYWREKVVFDRTTDCVHDLRTKYGLLGAVTQTEHGPLNAIRLEVFPNEKRYGVALRDAGGKAIEPPMLRAFKKEEQAQEVADILDAFLHQPALAETPGVWPPPPRVPRATHE